MRISVIIPVRNEEKSIRSLLEDLLRQTLPPTEIVITDGGSVDSTAEIIQSYINRGAPIQLVRATKSLPGRGRNLAAAKSVNEWLAFTDAGNRPNQDWLEALSASARSDPTVEVVYGAYQPVTDSFFTECATIAYVSPPTEVNGQLMRERYIASTLMRRSVWEAVGGFPENLRSAEDLLFMNRIDQGGFRIAYAPDAIVHWELQPTLWRTLKRFTIYARNNIRAGLWKQWQWPILSRYLIIAMLATPALFLGWRWLLLPVVAWLLLLVARAIVAIYRNRHASPASMFRNGIRLLVIVPLIAILDLGSIAGSVQWLVKDKLRLAQNGPKAGNDS
jgi:glycosyltransferase involved in cell wall biosynthesis